MTVWALKLQATPVPLPGPSSERNPGKYILGRYRRDAGCGDGDEAADTVGSPGREVSILTVEQKGGGSAGNTPYTSGNNSMFLKRQSRLV